MRRIVRRALTTAMAMTVIAVLAGCYERVVRAEGPGTTRYEVHEPNLKDERIPIADDVADVLLGEKKSTSSRTRP